MKNRKEIIVLVALLAVLGLVAAFMFLKPQRRTVRPAAQPEAATPGDAKQQPAARAAPATPEAVPVAVALPSQAELNEVAAWLVAKEAEASTAQCPSAGALGLQLPRPEAALTPGVTSTAAFTTAPPPKLEGIVRRGSARLAIIGGRLYMAGQKVRDTGCRVAAVGAGSVKLQADDGTEITLELFK